jgi:beta-glucanase (GH16 family)
MAHQSLFGINAALHNSGLLWTNSYVTYYVDEVAIFSTTNISPTSSPMYLVFFNIADNRTTNVMPSTMDVANVNVWSHP